MAKNFSLLDDEKFCIFVTKDKREAIILTMSYIEYLQVLTAKAVWNFLFLIVIFKLFRGVNVYLKPLLWSTQHKNKLELNAEIIARTKDIQNEWNFHLFIQEGLLWLEVFLNNNINLQNTRTLRSSNHIHLIWASLSETRIFCNVWWKAPLFSLS